MAVGSAPQPQSPLAFQKVGAGPHFPHVEWFPISIQLFLWCISVHHFCQSPSVFDPFSPAIFRKGKVSQPHTGAHEQAFILGSASSPPAYRRSMSCSSLPLAMSPVTLPAHVLTVMFTVCLQFIVSSSLLPHSHILLLPDTKRGPAALPPSRPQVANTRPAGLIAWSPPCCI